MLNCRMLLYTPSIDGFDSLIRILKNHCQDIQICGDWPLLFQALSSGGKNRLTVLFFPAELADSIKKIPGSILENRNLLLIVLSKGAPEDIQLPIYDVLDYGSPFHVRSFLNRLSWACDCKAQLLALESEIKEFYHIGKTLSAEKNPKALLETIIDASMKITGSDAGTIYLVINQDDGKWSFYESHSTEKKLLQFVIAKNNSMPISFEASTCPISWESIYGYTLLTGQPLRIDDAYHIPKDYRYRHNPSYDQMTGYKTRSILSIPMKDHQDRILGIIQLINKKIKGKIIPYDVKDEMIVYSLAGQAAVALENILLYRDMEDLLRSYKFQNTELQRLSGKILKAHEDERMRIARDIHDGPAQSMANASLKIEIMKKYLQRDMMEDFLRELDELNTNIKHTTKEIRKVIYDLKPSVLEMGLIHALNSHLSVFHNATGIQVNFHHTGDDASLQYYVTSTLYRIIQEATTNIRKHAEATKVDIFLNIGPEKIRLIIADNGKGFNPEDARKKGAEKLMSGFGLEGMKERMTLIQGSLNIDSKPGKGTRLDFIIPMKV
ncbi:MAG: GAF domain-containing sensor histidine kinase [Clostridia bacterium]|jgi:signal transduction histidine kinase